MTRAIPHLKILAILDGISLALVALASLFVVGSTIFTVALVARYDPAGVGALIPMILINGVALAFIGSLCVPLAIATLGVGRARARLSQSIVAVLSLSSVPFGTAFGLYALWVCWVNPETRDRFTAADGPMRRSWAIRGGAMALVPTVAVVALLALTIPAALPTDLDALDARWEPLADRAGRRAGAGCALTEVPTPDGCARAAPTSVRTEEVSFPLRTRAMGFESLNGTLHVPEGIEGPRPAVVLVHGSGPQDRHQSLPGELIAPRYPAAVPVFDQLAEALSERGFVVLQYDKRACAKCYPARYAAPDFTEFRFQLFVDDALDALVFLAAHPAVDADRLVVIGHSQGGSLAPHIAAAEPRVAAVVSLAGSSGRFGAVVVEQLEGYADLRSAQRDPLTAWALRLNADRYRACVGELDGDYDPADGCLGGGVTLLALAEYESLNDRTLAVVSSLQAPFFALNGALDVNVDPRHLLRFREAAAGRDAEFHLVRGVGHGLVALRDPGSPPRIAPQVMEPLAAFLSSVRPGVGEDPTLEVEP